MIFDTAPTGHTLRFLSMPNLFVKGMEKLGKLKGQFGSIVSQVCMHLSSVTSILIYYASCLSHSAC